MKQNTNKFLLLLSCLVVLSLAFTLAASDAISLRLESPDTTLFPKVGLRLSAWNGSGLPLADLKTGDAIVQEDGGEQIRPDSLQADPQSPLAVVMVLDVSGSMAGKPLQDSKAASARFLDHLSAKDQAAVIAFSEKLNPDPAQLQTGHEVGFSHDLKPAYTLVEGLTASGSTHLYDAVSKAVNLFGSQAGGHRAVLVLSDGKNEPADEGNPDQPINLARAAHIPVYVVGLGQQIDAPYLQRLATETGGAYRFAPASAELASLFNDMATLLKTQYQLVYTSKLKPDGKNHQVTVSLNSSGQTADSQIQIGPLPAALNPTAAPTALPTPVVEKVVIGTDRPMPTALPVVVAPVPLQPQQTPWFLIAGSVVALVFVLVIVLWLLRGRGPKLEPEACAKCGFDLTGKPGACPQCGETRRLPKPKK